MNKLENLDQMTQKAIELIPEVQNHIKRELEEWMYICGYEWRLAFNEETGHVEGSWMLIESDYD